MTVVSAKNRLGHPELEETRGGTTLRGQLKRVACRVTDVNSFLARFETGGSRFAEPLRNITISFDEEVHRPLLVIHLDGA